MGKKTNIFKQFFLEIFDLLSYIVFVAGIVFFIRFFVINPFNVVGSSMFPTIHDGDFILVDKITKRLHDYKRGDIVVFLPPGKTDPYVKRIIGLPGESVTIRDNTVTICKMDEHNQDTEQCSELSEDFLPNDSYTTASCGRDHFIVDKGYFVMGDNRPGSTDSRCCFGLQCFENTNYLVPDNYIIGKVILRLYPDIGGFSNPFSIAFNQ